MIREVFADVLLGLAAAIVLASALGILLMRSVYRKLHILTPAALVAPVLVAVAVWFAILAVRRPAADRARLAAS